MHNPPIRHHAGFRVVDVRGTLSYRPGEQEELEEPERNVEDKGFVCIWASKLASS